MSLDEKFLELTGKIQPNKQNYGILFEFKDNRSWFSKNNMFDYPTQNVDIVEHCFCIIFYLVQSPNAYQDKQLLQTIETGGQERNRLLFTIERTAERRFSC